MKKALRCGYGCGCCYSGGGGCGARLRNLWQPIADMSIPRENTASGVVCVRLVVVESIMGGMSLGDEKCITRKTYHFPTVIF